MRTEISGVINLSAITHWFLQNPMKHDMGGVYVWFTQDEEEALRVWRNLEFWRHLLPNYDKTVEIAKLLLPETSQFLSNLASLVGRKPGVYILPFSYWNDLVISSASMKLRALKLKVGDKITPLEIKQRLIALGYENSSEATLGTFKARGGTVTLHPLNHNEGVKIEFDEYKIIAISPLGARAKLIEIEILPLNINIIDGAGTDLSWKIFEFKNSFVRDVFIYRDPQILAALSDEWKELSEEIKNNNQLVFRTIGLPTASGIKKMAYKSTAKYFNDFNRFVTDLAKFQKEEYQIFLSVNDTAGLMKALKDNKIHLNTLKVVAYRAELEGFYNTDENVLFITEKEIFFSPESRRRKVKKNIRRVDWGFFGSIKPSEYVVHEDHGVANFGGLVKTTIGGDTREFFLLDYAQGDKLYLPVDQAHKIDKYIGQANPTIHRLSAAGWAQLTAKVKEDAHDLAQDLLNLYARRNVVQIAQWHPTVPEEETLAKTFPYKETPDQEKAIKDVFEDLEKNVPMDRLVIGDVGFGKTEVAMRAAFKAVMNNKQVAVLAPTTILVQQHLDTFRNRLANFGVNVQGLSRFTTIIEGTNKENEVLHGLKDGSVDIVVGTSRLLSHDVKFKDLGLVIIDEEQRFGVRHKEKLKTLRTQAHVLTLSATPIPRTFYLGISGLRNVSIISTPPPGRKEIETIIEEYTDKSVLEALTRELNRKGQAYYLYNKVASIEVAANRLRKLLGPNVKVAIIHGQMREEELARAMSLFDNGQIDVLVCSSIIENGLDLPNVNTLIVEDSTAFGLGQLYQLRGRIGRGTAQAYAHFLYRPERLKGLASERLKALQEAQKIGSGYQLALKDMEMRGVGNILGKQQHGSVSIVGLSTYLRLLEQAMSEIEDGVIIEPSEVKINLPISLGISEKIVADYDKRIQAYRAFALINDVQDLEEELTRFKKLYDVSHMDGPTQNFFELLKIKIMADSLKIKSIEYSDLSVGVSGKKGRITLNFTGFINPGQARTLKDSGWDVSGHTTNLTLSGKAEGALPKLVSLFTALGDTSLDVVEQFATETESHRIA